MTDHPTSSQVLAARQAAGLTQTAAAALIGKTLRAWQYWEAGQRKMDPALWKYWKTIQK